MLKETNNKNERHIDSITTLKENLLFVTKFHYKRHPREKSMKKGKGYFTVTHFARFLGISGLYPFASAT